MRATSTVTTLAAFALVAITAAGCSNGSKSSTAGGSAGGASAAGSAGAAGTAAGGSTSGGSTSGGSSSGGGTIEDGIGHPITLCSLLPVATVARLSGEDLTETQEQDTPGYKVYMCNYTSADGTSGVTVSVVAQDAGPGYDGSLQAAGPSAKQISGVGDKAFSAITGVTALFGNVSINVSNLQSDDAAVQIIKTLQPKL